MDGSSGDSVATEPSRHDDVPHKEIFHQRSPRSPLSTHSPGTESDSIDLGVDGAVDTFIEQLYQNVCEMQSSDQSPSKRSFLSYGEESTIDSELRYYAGVEFGGAEATKEVVMEYKDADYSPSQKEIGLNSCKFGTISKVYSSSAKSFSAAKAKRFSPLQVDSEASLKPSLRAKSFSERPPSGKRSAKPSKKQKPILAAKIHRSSPLGEVNLQNGTEDHPDAGYVGPYLLKQARDMVFSGDDDRRALELALRAMKAFEKLADEKPNLDFVMCLHAVAALHCRLGQYHKAIAALERSIAIPEMDEGQSHALAKFAGCMQLGDTYSMLGQIENSILCYTAGLEIQQQVLGETDPWFGETCRHVAEAHVQAQQFDEAEKLCQVALNIHKNNGSPASREEATDRKLMGLICDSKGDHEAALEHYVLAGMALAAKGQEADVASIDCNIGDAYLSLARYDEATFAYKKSLDVFRSTKGENHPTVASVFVRLANLYNKIGKFRKSKSYCENALRIYSKPLPGSPQEEITSGLIEISAIYESMNEVDQALKLLKMAAKAYGKAPGHQSTIAGIEAQIGILYYKMGSYSDSHDSFKNAILKFRETGEKKSALFGIALNQMGLACVQLYEIKEAAVHFEEAREILETECGPYHPDTLGVYSNLAGTYDAMGRTNDAIEILEYVVGMREEKLGTANPDVNDEKRRLAELLKESGRVRNRKCISLENLLSNCSTTQTDDTQVSKFRLVH